MALDFPASPATNQTYSGPGGVVWVWDGSKWVAGTGAVAYAPVSNPVFLGDPRAPNPPAGDADTSVATTSFVAAAVAPAFNGTGRNLLHNPLFNVAQRGAGPFTTSVYTLDRWFIAAGFDTYSITQQVLTDASRTQIGDEAATYALSNVFTGSANAAAFNFIMQKTEDVRRLGGKTVTVSFWALANAGGAKLGIGMVQNFGTGGSPSAAVQLSSQAVTLTTSFARYSATFAMPTIVGKTLGTNSDHYTVLEFWYSSGATNNANAGNIGVQSGTFLLWGVQLEIGSVATPLEKPDPRYDLSNCQRFYQLGSIVMTISGQLAGGNLQAAAALVTIMRASPTVQITANGSSNVSGISLAVYGPPTGMMVYTNSTTTAAGTASTILQFSASADL